MNEEAKKELDVIENLIDSMFNSQDGETIVIITDRLVVDSYDFSDEERKAIAEGALTYCEKKVKETGTMFEEEKSMAQLFGEDAHLISPEREAEAICDSII